MLDAGRVDAGALHVLDVLLSDAPRACRHPVLTNRTSRDSRSPDEPDWECWYRASFLSSIGTHVLPSKVRQSEEPTSARDGDFEH
jgi:hypothetical protein